MASMNMHDAVGSLLNVSYGKQCRFFFNSKLLESITPLHPHMEQSCTFCLVGHKHVRYTAYRELQLFKFFHYLFISGISETLFKGLQPCEV